MRPYRLIILLSVLVFGLSGFYMGIYEFYRAPADVAGLKPDFIFTADDIQKQFADDETAASAKYINKIIEVSGVVASVEESGKNQYNIALKTGNDMSSVICTVKTPPAITVNEGDKISIRGECSGYLMDVLMNNCVIVK